MLELSCIHQDQGAIDAIRALSNAQDRSTEKYPSSGPASEMLAHYLLLRVARAHRTPLGSSVTAKWPLTRDLHASSQINLG